MELTFLFWNTSGNKCLEEINNLIDKHKIDIVILAENSATTSEMLLKINEFETTLFPQHPSSLCKKIKIYSNFHYDYITPIEESARITARSLTLPTLEKINLIAIHFGDKGNFSSESQSEMASELKIIIDSIEEREGHKRTIVVGDLNMNPFELGVIKANGLNATMSYKVAKQNSRRIQTVDYEYFYNPMWSLFGDLIHDTPGSYYYRRAELVNYQWNIFDQVLVRPSLIDNLDKASIRILKQDGKKELITKDGIPNKKKFSDHLPIKFKFNF